MKYSNNNEISYKFIRVCKDHSWYSLVLGEALPLTVGGRSVPRIRIYLLQRSVHSTLETLWQYLWLFGLLWRTKLLLLRYFEHIIYPLHSLWNAVCVFKSPDCIGTPNVFYTLVNLHLILFATNYPSLM